MSAVRRSVVAILQARMSSTRLPGKVMKPLLGQPMLARQIERVRRARLLEGLVIATSTDPRDDVVAQLSASLELPCYRGSLPDVLDRYRGAAEWARAEVVVRLTGDCPLADPEVIDSAVQMYLDGPYDYVSNTVRRTYPHGLDVEVFGAAALAAAAREAHLPSDREHVTRFFYTHPRRFRSGMLLHGVDLSHLRWTVDEPEDFVFVEQIYRELYPRNPAFTTADVLRLLEQRPELLRINARHIHRSVAADGAATAAAKSANDEVC